MTFNGEHEASKIVSIEGFRNSEENAIKSAWTHVQNAIERAGFDGVSYENEWEGGESWIAFRPEQIKSAIGNSGLFSRNDPDFADSRYLKLKNSEIARAWINDRTEDTKILQHRSYSPQ